MVCIGEDQTYTAMAKTVGLPALHGNLANLERKITTPGVQLPIRKVSTDIERIRRIWCFKEQSMTYYGYKPDNT
jgi:hypothetical protein